MSVADVPNRDTTVSQLATMITTYWHFRYNKQQYAMEGI